MNIMVLGPLQWVPFIRSFTIAYSPLVCVTVSERSQWQDVLLLKTKLEMLTGSYHQASSSLDRRAAADVPPSPGVREDVTSVTSRWREGAEFGYASLGEWEELVTARFHEGHAQCEAGYLEELQRTLLPLASGKLAGHEGGAGDVTAAVGMLQGVGVASGLPTRPVYLNTDHLTSE